MPRTILNFATFTMNPMKQCFAVLVALGLLALPLALLAQEDDAPPDILFVILDDAGIDQFTLFGNGGAEAPETPNIDAIAAEGVRFSNAWATPECSPSRSAFFTGRWGLRTGVTTALIPNMLPQAQVSPYEVTVPRLLSTAGYRSAMVGKYHMGNVNPSGSCSPATRGFDYFRGNMEAGPPAIDTQAGRLAYEPGSYDCGFVRDEIAGIPVTGACYFQAGACQAGLTGKQCLQQGGLLDPSAACQAEPPADFDFERSNGYYVWPETLNVGALPAPTSCSSTGEGCANLSCPGASTQEPPLVRDYMSESQTDSGVEWWNAQDGPRMLTVSYNAIHTPYQQPPTVDSRDPIDARACQGDEVRRFEDTFPMLDGMFTSVDREIAILLQDLGLATLDSFGGIAALQLDEHNTMLVIVGDNGSFAPSVRLPYDPTRAKGSVFQTGVLVPLVVAGPLVSGETGRDVSAMVNVADLYGLFANFAGIDPATVVPPSHRLDSEPMIGYLEQPHAAPVRTYNYAEVAGENTLATPVDPDNRLWPCVILASIEESDEGDPEISGGFCNDLLFDTRQFCESNTGTWFGPGSDYQNPNASLPGEPDGAWGSCCQVYEAFSNPDDPMGLAPVAQRSVQDGQFKLVEISQNNCDMPSDDPRLFPPYERRKIQQFYDLSISDVDYLATEVCSLVDTLTADVEGALVCNDQSPGPGLPNGNACANAPECLQPFPGLFRAYAELDSQLNALLSSQQSCPGDGNLDMRVTELDVQGVQRFMGAGPSYFDMNKDGQTNQADLDIVMANLGNDCIGACRRADLNRDNVVTAADEALLSEQMNTCSADLTADVRLCAADLDGNMVVNDQDRVAMSDIRRANRGEPCPVQVMGQDDPETDTQAIQAAIDLASLDPNGGRVVLEGAFDLGGCSFCINIHGPVILEGAIDPTGPDNPTSPRAAMLHNAGISPLVISDYSDGSGVIRVENLWFNGGQGLAVDVTRVSGKVELVNNRVTGYSAFFIDGASHRFALAAAGFAPGSDDPENAPHAGDFLAMGNHIDNRDEPFEIGDDNGISLLRCRFDRIDILNNTVYTRGESIEIESCANPAAVVNISGNDIITDAAISDRAPLTVAPRLEIPGGHPASLKVAAAEAAQLIISGNQVRMWGESSAVCIMPGLVNPEGSVLISDNHCSMDGQYAGLLGGWAGTPGLFGPFYLRNADIRDNVFEGTAYLGIAFSDFDFTGFNPGEAMDLVNRGRGNVFRGNNLEGLQTDRAALYYGDNARDNVFYGSPGGSVEDYGSNNELVRQVRARGDEITPVNRTPQVASNEK